MLSRFFLTLCLCLPSALKAQSYAWTRLVAAGRLALRWHENAEAERFYKLALAEAAGQALEQGLALEGLAKARMRLGAYSEAGQLLAQARHLLKEAEENPQLSFESDLDRAEWLEGSGQKQAALNLLLSLEPRIRQAEGPGSPNLPPLLLRRGRLEKGLGRTEAARKDFSEARDLARKIWDGVNPWYLASLTESAALERAIGNAAAAQVCETEIAKLQARVQRKSSLRELP